MDEKTNLFEKFIEEEMAKSPEELAQEVVNDPEYPRITPSPESYEKLRKRIQEYEAEKAVISQLSESDQEALRLGRELQAKLREQEAANINTDITVDVNADDGENVGAGNLKIEEKKVIYRRKGLRRKVVLVAAATMVLTLGVGVISLGGPSRTLKVARSMFEGRTRITVDSEAENKTVVNSVEAEEAAYQKIEDELGFAPVRMGYLPEGVTFEKISIDTNFQRIIVSYGRDDESILYVIKGNYTGGKSSVDIEDEVLKSYTQNVSGVEVLISEYWIEDLEETRYSAEYIYNNTWYCIMRVQKVEEIEKIVENLFFS